MINIRVLFIIPYGLNAYVFKSPTTLTSGWHPVGFSHNIKHNKPYRVDFYQEYDSIPALVVWRDTQGDVVARPDICPHLGYTLSKGSITNDGCVRCPYHGLKVGMNSPYEVARETVGKCYEENGIVWWNNDKDETYYKFSQDLMNMEEDKSTIVRWEMDVKASFSDCYRNTMDLHHAGWVHSSSFGNKINDPDTFDKKWLDNRTLRIDFDYYSNDKFKKYTGKKTSNYHIFQYPSTTWNKVLNEDKQKYVFIHVALRAISATSTKWYLTASSNYVDNPILPETLKDFVLEKMTRQIAEFEDKVILENMQRDEYKNRYSYKIKLPLDDIYSEYNNRLLVNTFHENKDNLLSE